jgi:hypothetical protein
VDLYIGLEANGGGSRYNSLEGGHRFYISSTEKVRINTDGNVGIGTTSPTAKVESYFSSNAITFNYLATNLNGNSPIPVYGFDVTSGAEVRSIKAGIGYERHLTNGRGTLHIYNRSSDDTSNFSGTRSSAGDIKISIDNSGNVGIGTTIPNSKLQISGSSAGLLTVGTLTNDWGGVVAIGTPNGNGIILSKVNTSNDANRVLTIVRDDTNGASIFAYTPTGTSTSVGFQIRASASSYFNGGNVGIGTSSPDTKLDVRGVVQSQSYPVVNTSGTGQWVKLGTLTIPQSGYTAHIRAYIHSGYNALNSQDYYLDIFFKTSNASSVDANGFAGNSWYYTRGYTTSDPSPIWVGNAAGVSATAYDLYLSLPAFTNHSHYIVEIVEGVTWANVGTLGQTYPGTGSSTVCVSSLGFTLPIGNVGIGTSTLTTKFNVYDASSGNADEVFLGTIGTNQLVGGRTDGSFGIATKSASNGNLIFTANNEMYFRTSGSNDRMFIKNDGNVGIGTTSPAAKLYVVSSGGPIARFDGSSVATSGATEIDILGPQSNGDLNLGIGGSTLTDATNNIQNKAFVTAGTGLSGLNLRSDAGYVQITTGGLTSANERMRITSDGKVGIGTTSPVTQFQVSGSATIGGYNTFYFGTGVTSFNITAPLYPVLAFYYGTNFAGTITGYSDHIGINTGAGASKYISFEPNDSEAMRITADGALLVGKTVGYGTGTAENNTLQLKSFLVFGSDNTGSASNRNWNISTNGSAAGNMDWTVGSTNTGWPNFAYRLQLTSSGSLNNTTGTYGTISDLRLKENISDARNYLDDLLKLRVVKYSLKEESSDFATKIGFIAQEVEQVFPNLVDQSDVGYDGGEGIRSVKTSILIPMLLKSIQELSAKVKSLEDKVQILESK